MFSIARRPVIAALLIVLGTFVSARADSGDGVHFIDMIGVNRAVTPAMDGHDLLLGDVIKHNRNAYQWQDIQPQAPEPGNSHFNTNVLNSIQASFGGLSTKYGVDTLPVIAYSTSWAGDHSEVTFDYQGSTYHRYVDMNQPAGKRLVFDQKKPDGTHFTRYLSLQDIQLPTAPQYTDDWANFTRQVVNSLGAEKGGSERYYQIYNEPHPSQIYYHGSWDEFFNNVVKPAAEKIRTQTPDQTAAGIVGNRKVVFPGWIDQPGVGGDGTEVPRLLNEYDAWDYFDVINTHYNSLKQQEAVRQLAEQSGHGDIPIWETEFTGTPVRRRADGTIRDTDGTLFTEQDQAEDDSIFIGRDPGSLGNFSPRFAYWANLHNDGDDERYRAYYFTYWSPDGINDPALIHPGPGDGPGYETLVMGTKGNTELTVHGQAVKTVSSLLNGGTLRNYDSVTTDTGLGFDVDERKSSIESFTIDSDEGNDRLVVAVHLTDADEDGSIKVLLSDLTLARIKSAQRVTPWDEREAITAQANPDGEGVFFDVTTDDLTGPNGQDWYNVSVLPRTFYLNLTLNPAPVPEPASAALLGLGVGGVLIRRRSRRSSAERR